MPHNPSLNLVDRLIVAIDGALGSDHEPAASSARPYPAKTAGEDLEETERRHSAGLMRVNHAGEIAAQGLYHGQAITARDTTVQAHLYRAADEENDHLTWCERRLSELHARPSRLAPLWYMGSLTIGALAGVAGDRWSLGFIAETEKQVVEHLDSHFDELPEPDLRSREVIDQMREDEARHAQDALDAGGQPLPAPIRFAMRMTARIMTSSAYRV